MEKLPAGSRAKDRPVHLAHGRVEAVNLPDVRLLQFPFRDIAGDADNSDDRAVVIKNRNLCCRAPCHTAIRPGFHFLHIFQRFAGGDDPLFILVGLAGVLFVEEVEVRLADNLLRIAEAENFGVGRIDFNKPALPVFEINAILCGIQQTVQQPFGIVSGTIPIVRVRPMCADVHGSKACAD